MWLVMSKKGMPRNYIHTVQDMNKIAKVNVMIRGGAKITIDLHLRFCF